MVNRSGHPARSPVAKILSVIIGGTVPGRSARPSALVLGSRRVLSCSLRGESPQSSSRRAFAHLLLCMHTSVGRNRSASNAHSQQSHTSHKSGINCKHTHTQPTLSAAFPARQAMSAASRQILTAYSRRRSPAVYWRTAHGGRSARILSAVALVVLVSSDRGRPHEPRGFGSRELCGRLIERRWWRRGKRANATHTTIYTAQGGCLRVRVS